MKGMLSLADCMKGTEIVHYAYTCVYCLNLVSLKLNYRFVVVNEITRN